MRKLLRFPEVCLSTASSKSTIKRHLRNPDSDFPRPIDNDAGIAWFEDEIEAWKESRPRRQYTATDGQDLDTKQQTRRIVK